MEGYNNVAKISFDADHATKVSRNETSKNNTVGLINQANGNLILMPDLNCNVPLIIKDKDGNIIPEVPTCITRSPQYRSIEAMTQIYRDKGYSLTAWDRKLGKAPRVSGWDKQTIEKALSSQNIGVIHGLSGTFCFDIDNIKLTRKIFANVLGINIENLIAEHYGWYGNPSRIKLIMRVPQTAQAGLKAVKLPYPKDHKEKGEAFSLRGATLGEDGSLKAVMDVLPPSVHPDTQKPYMWRFGDILPPLTELPYMPDDLLGIWEDWNTAKDMIEEYLGWREKPTLHIPIYVASSHKGDSIIEKYNQSTDIRGLIESYGYIPRGKDKWVSPNSSTNMAGVVLMENEGKEVLYTHHGSDTWGDGHSYDAFGLYAHFEHGDDLKSAVKALRGIL